MIPVELLHGAIGFVIALIGQRLGLPFLGSVASAATSSSNSGLPALVRTVLVDILRGLNQPNPDDELRQHLQAAVTKKV